MLHEFVTLYRGAIISKTRSKVSTRGRPPESGAELEHGVPAFLDQLAETLRLDGTAPPFSSTLIDSTATLHGRDLLARGFNVSQVVHDYGDMCEAITELAVEQNIPITTREFVVLNRCLDTAIADAVTEHARITAESRVSEDLERLGHVAHEGGNMLNTALLAFESVKRSTLGINGSTGAVLGRSLTDLRDLFNSTLSDIRTAASHQRPEYVSISTFLSDVGVAAALQAEYHQLQLTVAPGPAGLGAWVDRQLLESALMNLVNNAFKYTSAGGRIVLRAHAEGPLVVIEVEDQCGGMPDAGDPFKPFGERRGKNRSGLGLGLSVARKAVRSQGGEIHVRNLPGKGCVFTIHVPAATREAPISPAV